MNAQRAVRSLLAAIPIAGFWLLDFSPNLLFLKENSSRWVILAIYPDSQIAAAGPIVPAADGTGTAVTPAPTGRYDITGGTKSQDGANLFHSFTRFGLNSGETANFISNPGIQNILGRVVGGDASLINGLIRVTGGNSNLFLINPAGIIFGANARLDVSGSFFATTASGIGFDNRWLSGTGASDYASLVGAPNAFVFGSQPGSIVNAGDLAVGNGQNLTLLGGSVISTGQLSAPGGQITVAAVPGENLVRLSQNGLLLSLEVSASQSASGSATVPFSPLSLPRLLSGPGVTEATGITANDRGEVVLTGGQTVAAVPGSAIVSGAANVSARSGAGGTVNVLGDRVGLVGAKIDASGPSGGGTVRVGGDYRGGSRLPAARMTFVDGKSSIAANATQSGNGGNVVVWADNTAAFLGSIEARGVSTAKGSVGAGGLVEVSGKQRLIFNGTVDTSGTNGLGTLLLDPENIFITDAAETPEDAAIIANNNILAAAIPNSSEASLTISARALENMSATSNVVLEALNNIKIEDLADNELSLKATTGSIAFKADADRSGAGAFSMNPQDRISTAGGSISISGNQIMAGNLSSNGGNISLIGQGATGASNISALNTRTGNSGNILLEGVNVTAEKIDASGPKSAANVTLTAQNILAVRGIAAGAGNITLTGNEINLTGGANSVTGSGFLVLQPWSPAQNIAIGGSGDVGTNTFLNLTGTDLSTLQNGFSGITIGRNNGVGAILLANDFTFYDPLIIQSPGASGTITASNELRGADNASLTLKADGNIRTGNISTNGQEIRLASKTGNVTAGQLQTGTVTDSKAVDTAKVKHPAGGDVSVTAEGKVTVASIGSKGQRGGNVTLTGRNGVSVGAIDAGSSDLSQPSVGGNITVTGNEIDLTGGKNSVASNGNLVLQPIEGRQNITLGGVAQTDALDLTAAELTSLRNGFASIAIGSVDGSGTIAIVPPATATSPAALTFQDPTTIRAPLATGAIQGTSAIAGIDNASITLFAGSVSVGDVTSNAGINISSSQGNVTTGTLSSRSASGAAGDISIRSAGAVAVSNVNAFGDKSGGDISISAPGQISTGVINSGSQSGKAGSSTITGQKDVEVASIKARGNTGGDVEVATGGAFRSKGTGTTADRATVSISTDGRVQSGSLTLLQRDCKSGTCSNTPVATVNNTPKTVANTTASSPLTIAASPPPASTVELKTTGNSQQLVSLASSVTLENPAKSSTANISSGAAAGPLGTGTNAVTAGGAEPTSTLVLTGTQGTSQTAGNGDTATTPQKSSSSIAAETILQARVPEISRSNSIAVSPMDAVQKRDQIQGREFERYFGRNLDQKFDRSKSIGDTLSTVNQQTGVKPAIVYVWAKSDRLELVMLLPDGKNIFKSVSTSRETVLQVAKDFTNSVRTPRRLNAVDYKEPAAQLYQWLIAPLQPELERHNIDTLVFSMDAGLRTLPLAALYDGKQFLVEKYSLGLIPSLSLTDTRYADVKDSKVLAMGASKFPEKYDQNPLPAVPLEISTIVGKIWPGSSFLNEYFTLPNLQKKRNQEYKIIHLATHGDFQPGGAENSYIQFWDTKLRLNQLNELSLSNPQAELLVLSACTTAVGDEQAELGFAGLAVHAGVKSALASLWYVSDAATLGLMTEFYQQLRTAPIKAEALRRAQLSMLRSEVRLQDGYLVRSGNNQALPLPAELTARGDRNLSHPYYWAAFTMIGSPW